MKRLRDYLKDENGKPSSTRLFSWYFLWFFFVLNAIYFGLTEGAIDVNFIVYDFMLLIAIFAPKHLTKLTEVKKLIKNEPK